MDKVFHSTFDFFSHAIPGFCVIASLFVLSGEVDSPMTYLELANGLQVGGGILLLVVGYIVGFAIYPLGRALYKGLGLRIWRKQIHHDLPLFISEKYVLIREYSPANFKYVELWNMFCSMSHNLAVASLVLAICCTSKIIMTGVGVWLGVAIIAVFLVFVFLHRAVVFYVWAADDLNSAIISLDLTNKQVQPKDQKE